MVSNFNSVRIWYSDYGDVWLKRERNKIQLKRFTPLDYDYMQEYIDENVDMLSEWQEAAYHGETEDSYEYWRENYDYSYWDYFSYDQDGDCYYNEDDNDMTWDWFDTDHDKDYVIEDVMWILNDDYIDWTGFTWDSMNENRFREIVGQYYDECKEFEKYMEEQRKPHWNAFSYYK